MAPQDGSDEYWMEVARDRPEAFAEVVSRYQDRIYSYTFRMTGSREDAQDLTQETFIRVYTHLDSFRIEERFSPWIYRIATNLCLNLLKRRKRTVNADWQADNSISPSSPESALEEREEQRVLQAAILQLPDQYRVAILLRHVHELSYDEIAQALEMPLGTVKTRLFRARELLQEKLRTYRYGEDHGLRARTGAIASIP